MAALVCWVQEMVSLRVMANEGSAAKSMKGTMYFME